MRLRALFILVVATSMSLSVGCAPKSVLEAGQSTALDGVDLVQMTDAMAMSLANDPEVIAEFQRNGPLVVVVMPVENRLTGEIIPRGAATAFTGRVRTQLTRQRSELFSWVMNREAWYDLRKSELEGIDPGPSPEAISPRFALTATFSSLTHEDPKRRSIYYLCAFDLKRLDDRTIIWSDKYEVKKIAVKGFLD